MDSEKSQPAQEPEKPGLGLVYTLWWAMAVAMFPVIGVMALFDNHNRRSLVEQSERAVAAQEQMELTRLAALPAEQRAAAEATREEKAQLLEQSLREAAGQAWRYTEIGDPKGGQSGRQASVDDAGGGLGPNRAREVLRRASLIILDHPRYGNDVLITLRDGWFACGLNECRVEISFDGAPATTYRAAAPFEIDGKAISIHDFDRFLNNTRAASRVRIQAQLYGQGQQSFEFDVRGLEWP